ncbi:fumarylacetoacetate hydrolase family protein [Duganella sp. BuS-21]|uniref:fumarylacetoacetate hydrolase family protein n=1 Tax=Duganella sp. BuS-21 TaxID=2943848 RepID=UPI0035A68F2F
MKFASFRHGGKETFGVVDGNAVIDLGDAGLGRDLLEFLACGHHVTQKHLEASAVRVPLEQLEYLPVIADPQKILCVGINYLSHVKETGREIPKFPMIFTRFADSQTGHGQPIVRPNASHKLDFEGELAVVIGKKARHVKAEDALGYIAGYSCYNDGSVRDWQKHSIQFIPGKNFPSTGGFGPWLVTPDEVGDPSALTLVTRLNGNVVQEARTDDLIFPIAELIEYCSTFTELNPGDVIITGTTGGVGAFREPPLWMQPGDVVEVEISRIGTLVNHVIQES